MNRSGVCSTPDLLLVSIHARGPLFIQFQKGNSQKFVKPTFSEVGISPVLRGRISYVRWTTKLLVLYSLPGPTDRGRASFAWRGFSEVQDRNPSTLALRLCGFA
jgi:hypothetical protein